MRMLTNSQNAKIQIKDKANLHENFRDLKFSFRKKVGK